MAGERLLQCSFAALGVGYWPVAPPEGSGSGLGVEQDLSAASERGEGASQASPLRANTAAQSALLDGGSIRASVKGKGTQLEMARPIYNLETWGLATRNPGTQAF